MVDFLDGYSLIRRLCSHIIIGNAEHDALFQFNAYLQLQKALRTEMGVDFYVKDIEDALKAGHFSGEKPVMCGTIAEFPLLKADGTTEKITIKVVYIKLSVDPKLADGSPGVYGKEICDFYHAHTKDTFFLVRRTAFLNEPPQTKLFLLTS